MYTFVPVLSAVSSTLCPHSIANSTAAAAGTDALPALPRCDISKHIAVEVSFGHTPVVVIAFLQAEQSIEMDLRQYIMPFGGLAFPASTTDRKHHMHWRW